jgi:carbohydrate-selective porin OprB
MISGDRQFGGHFALAGRWSKSFERLSADHRELASLGLMWLQPFSRSQDIAGLGFFVGDPSDPDRGTESGFEVFYRLKLTQAVSVMPDLQYWSRDDRHGEGARTWAWGIRAEFEY